MTSKTNVAGSSASPVYPPKIQKLKNRYKNKEKKSCRRITTKKFTGMRIPWKVLSLVALALFYNNIFQICKAQDYGGDTTDTPATPPPEIEKCDGIFASYVFQGREKEYPFVKNVTAQAWSFQAMATVLNTGAQELKSWKLFIGFQHRELLVSVDGAVVVDGGDGFPIRVGNNGTTLAGFPQTDLETAIDTAGDLTQMQAQINLKGTQFGLSAKAIPMPRSLKLMNDGFKCPAATRKGTSFSLSTIN